MPDEQEQDVFARAGITDEDFADEPEVGSVEAPVEAEAPEAAQADGPARDEHGRFAPKTENVEVGGRSTADAQGPEVAPVAPAPAVDLNLSAAERAAWSTVPPELRGAVERRVTEMERGLTEYRAKWAPMQQFAEMAERGGTTLADAAAHYIGMEQMIAQNPIQGLDTICRNLGTDLRTVAAHVLGQDAPEPNAQVQQLSQQMRNMEAELAHYRAQERRQQEQAQSSALDTVTKFSTSAPRWAELEHYVSWALQTGAVPRTGDAAKDLEAAYHLADRLVPGSAPAVNTAPAQQEPRTPPANLSVDGGPGSNPGYSPPKDRRQNIGDRLAQFGL